MKSLPGYHHSGEGEAYEGMRVRVKDSAYVGVITKSHGGGEYSVRLDRGTRVDPQLAGPSRPVRYSHHRLQIEAAT